MTDMPTIDVSGLRTGNEAERRAVAAAIGRACREIGFFYAAGHGVPEVLLETVFAESRRFFALPVADKQTLSLRHSATSMGYGELRSEQLDPTAPADLNETYNIGWDLPADHPEIRAGAPFRSVNRWPDLPGWRQSMLDYFEACTGLGRLIHRGFSLDLGLDEDFFEDKLDRPMGVLRLLHYPAQPEPVARQFGAGEHTDYGNLTLLATDGVAGLQLRTRHGDWLDAPSIPGAYICNIGDCLMRWTNDTYVSTPHRVLPPARERYSIPFFLDPNPDALVETIPGFGASKYPPITAADYIKQRFDETYPHRAAAAAS